MLRPGVAMPSQNRSEPGAGGKPGWNWRAMPDRIAAWWRNCEDTYLSPTHLTLEERAAQAEFGADDPDAFCNRCGETLTGVGDCPACAERLATAGPELPWSRFIRLGEYDGVLRAAVKELKFDGFRPVGRGMGRWLGLAIREQAEQHAAGRPLLIVPVPTSLARRLVRGIDHTRVIATAAAAASGGVVAPLLKKRWRPRQAVLTTAQRKKNVAGSMRAVMRPPPGSVVVLVDDVKTTGATLREACRALGGGMKGKREAGEVFVWVATVAVTADRRWKHPEGG